MTIDKLNQGSDILRQIQEKEKTRDSIEKFRDCEEVIILRNTPSVQTLIRDLYFDDRCPNPIYTNNQGINQIVDVLVKPINKNLEILRTEFNDL